MIEINLAPGADTRRGSRRSGMALQFPSMPALGGDPRVVAMAAAGFVLLLMLAFAFWRQSQRLETLQARVEQEVTDSTRFATTIALIKALQERQDTIRSKIAVIQEVDQRRYVWPHLLDEVSRALPVFTWLTQINAGEAVDSLRTGPVFTLQGNAGSTQALTRFMKNLESSPFVRDVTLVTSEQVDVEGRTLHRFALEARYEVPDSSVIETVPIVVIE